MHPILIAEIAEQKVAELRTEAAVARRALRGRDRRDGSGPVRTPAPESPPEGS
jgi:hypothetical protein